jgi:hypothetical protein
MRASSKGFSTIFLWTHPRSMSSAMERVMWQRGDLKTLHEPFLYLYYLGDANKQLQYFDPLPGHPTSYAGIKAMIQNASKSSDVFVKDMCYFVSNYIESDRKFLRQLSNTFLIRTPEQTVPSYYNIDPKVTLEEIGLEAVYRHFQLVTQECGQIPLVIDAQDLARDPQGTLRAYCAALELPYIEESLSWDNDALPEEWRHVAGWHTDLSTSSGLGKVQPARTSLSDAAHLQQMCDHHMPFYEKLRSHRLKPHST